MTEHWMAKYIGLEWMAGKNDCWSFFRRVQHEQFGVDVPAVDIDAMNLLACVRAFDGNEERSNWRLVPDAEEGDAVLIGKGRHASHIGIWAADGVLHCIQGAGVVHQKLASMRIHKWSNIIFYRHLPCAQS